MYNHLVSKGKCMHLLTHLKTLITTAGLSGDENPIAEELLKSWSPWVDEVHRSRIGSLHALKRGSLPEPRPKVMVAAHMDSIGLMVTEVVDGFLRVTAIGGLDARLLPGQLVTVHARRELAGVVVQPPDHLLPDELAGKVVPLDHLFVDVGLLPSQVERLVRVGDRISFAQPPMELGKDFLAGHSLDNRASAAALTLCLEELQGRELKWDFWAVATAQEEETLGGAATSAYQLRPDLAVAVDVIFGDGPGTPDYLAHPLGSGVALGWGANVHPALFSAFRELAERLEIPWKMEPLPRHSGTDAFAMQVAAEGIPTMVVYIPLRYMHSAVELVCLKDIARAARLLAEFVTQLDEHFLSRITWDE